jgi:ribosomal protein S18 acetylase RimI-like enzyme
MSAWQIADFSRARLAELDLLWQEEERWWRDCLDWDIGASRNRLRWAAGYGAVSSKILLDGDRVVGSAYYTIVEHLGTIWSVIVPSECDGAGRELLVHETVGAMRQTGVSRIESPSVSLASLLLRPLFEREGFATFWRDFLKHHLPPDLNPQQGSLSAVTGTSPPVPPVEKGAASMRGALTPPPHVYLDRWRTGALREAALMMHAAYDGEIDAEINQQYRSLKGCELLLSDILTQGACGIPVDDASIVARQRGRGLGFILVTEISPRQAHLAQIAVLPEFQHQGIARFLLTSSLANLAERGFDSISLNVTRRNSRALKIYQLIGFERMLSFPVFVWQK